MEAMAVAAEWVGWEAAGSFNQKASSAGDQSTGTSITTTNVVNRLIDYPSSWCYLTHIAKQIPHLPILDRHMQIR